MEHKTEGIFAILEDESKRRVPSADNFMNTIASVCSKKMMFEVPLPTRNNLLTDTKNCFIIQHFAGKVTYSSVSFSND